ncbi:Pyruvate phosphate dikinase, PEP/pyruvate binding domain [Marinobacter sp. LV10R510-11A]|uniref:PEP/pyruvate-binding domain-containing protein n=1 Tax=Marinobacter sp. LV10R510-11A TaxID=1415568 RepID=UPI000BB754C6|nr:PEP/pyruvate-binding domain-containing protein [Marinobacter sp. LV10R510-11A]SOB77079.1 Pyruvate phosphate dikinase, PEP/pyruvate binding domain [Marinobacter sp. LV10R510-11A]
MTGNGGNSQDHNRVSTGLPSLDDMLDGLRIGDNVVWRVSDLDDYRRFVTPFIESAASAGRRIIYLRFGQHPPLVSAKANIHIENVDALGGFEAFTGRVWRLIEEHGRGAFYVCDCLSDLLNAWATDVMVGNFFQVVCPFLFELETVAWFALYPDRHSRTTLDRIRQTTQVMVDVHRLGHDVQIQPIKAWCRQSPTMFLPHRELNGRFVPVTDSSDATRLQAGLELAQLNRQPLLDYWDRLFLQVSSAIETGDKEQSADILDRVLNVLISRDPRMLDLAKRYLSLESLLAIRARMIGSGYIGGKATGMLIARSILLANQPDIWQKNLEPHDSSYLGSDAYYAFLVHNGLWPAIMRQRSADGYFSEATNLRQGLLAGRFPPEIRAELERLLDHYGQYPILVRSSSLQEDGFGNAFAGKYDSVFLVNQGAPEHRLTALEDAIQQVYASTMSDDALVYRKQRGLDQREEPMALLIQRVNGRFHGRYYLPDAAGVGVSRNTFAWDTNMNPAAGMVRLVMGLGTRAVDRIEDDHACVMALDYPSRQPFRNQDESYRFSQHLLDVLDLWEGQLATRPLSQLTLEVSDLPLEHLGEVDQPASRRAEELDLPAPVWRLTFKPLVRNGQFVARLSSLLKTLEAGYQHPVDVEFTLHLDDIGEPTFNLVQCRPLATIGETTAAEIPAEIPDHKLLFRTRGHFMGGNINLCVQRVIRVDAAVYSRLTVSQRYEVARLIGEQVRTGDDKTMLIGPGRWGTSSPELGVPVRFADIARVSVLVEVAEMDGDMVPDLSYGSHFFQDLVETGIAYVALFPNGRNCTYQLERLPGINTHVRDASPERAIQIFDLRADPLQLTADVVSQNLACYFPD